MNIQVFENILYELHSTSNDITASALVASDGIPLCSILHRDTNPDRAGGMAAAMLALSKRATKELIGGTVKQTIIESDDGILILVQADKNSVLILTARKDAKLGMLLICARNAVKKIQAYTEK